MNLSQILSRWFLIPVSEVEVFTQNFTHAPEGVLPVIHEEVLHLNTKKKKRFIDLETHKLIKSCGNHKLLSSVHVRADWFS